MDVILGCLFLFFATGLLFLESTAIYNFCIEIINDFSIQSLFTPNTIFGIILIVITLSLFYKGFIMIWRYIDTKTKGIHTYAMVVNCIRKRNDDSYYYYIDYIAKNELNEIKEFTKLEMTSSDIGTFAKVKLYKKNIIVMEEVKSEEVPQILKEQLIAEEKLRYKKEEENN